MAKTVKTQPTELAKPNKIRIAISTSVLFDMSKPNAIFKEHGEDAYIRHMVRKKDKPLPLGQYFDSLKNKFNHDLYEIVVFSRNNPITARCAIMTLQHQGITPAQLIFTCGRSPVPYLETYGIQRFMTTHKQDAEDCHTTGILATLYDPSHIAAVKAGRKLKADFQTSSLSTQPQKLVYTGPQDHTVFDLDGVLFDQESEHVYKDQGLPGYREHEGRNRDVPLNPGTAYRYLKALDAQNDHFAPECPPHIISIVTARGKEAAIRAIETLAKWEINITGEAHFLEGRPKTPILQIMAARAHKEGMTIEFFDDQIRHIKDAAAHGIFAGQVPGFSA